MAQLFANAARSLLMAGISAVDTSITVDLAKADLFPVADTGTDPVPTVGKDWFKVVLQDNTGAIEIIYVRTRTAGSASMTNCLRGQDGTTAIAFLAGSIVGLRHTAADLAEAVSFANGASAFWKSLVSWTTAALSRSALGATAVGDAVFIAANQAAARSAIGAQAAGSYQPAGSYAADGDNNDITRLLALVEVPAIIKQYAQQIQSLPDPTLAGNAMTLPASTHSLEFRSATLGSGVPALVTGSASALVIPAGATLGTLNGVQNTLIEVICNNGGTLHKAVVNLVGGNDLSESGVISTTAISAGATSANVFYSNTALTNVPYRVMRAITSTQTTAGQWVTGASLVQGRGGLALAAMQSLGFGQTWQSVTRVNGTTYYNTTGKPIVCAISLTATGAASATVNGVTVWNLTNGSTLGPMLMLVPPGASYSYSGNSGSVTELR